MVARRLTLAFCSFFLSHRKYHATYLKKIKINKCEALDLAKGALKTIPEQQFSSTYSLKKGEIVPGHFLAPQWGK